MKKLFLFFVMAFSIQAMASWTAGGGVGLTIGPTLFLVSPELQHRTSPQLSYGPLVQLGVGDSSQVLLTGGILGKMRVGHHSHLHPFIEGGLGIAFGSSISKNNFGAHILFGMGADYDLGDGLSLGTVIRANLAPPLKTFFASWPLIVLRIVVD